MLWHSHDEMAMRFIYQYLKTFKEQQRKEGLGPYKFQRKTERALIILITMD